MGKLGFLLSMTLTGAVVTSLIVNIHQYATNNQLSNELVLARTYLPLLVISNQSSAVREYLKQHPNAQWSVMKLYVGSNGSVYTVDDSWELQRYVGGTYEPEDSKSHDCWRVHFYYRTYIEEPIINVFIDKDNWEIVLVEEAWQS